MKGLTVLASVLVLGATIHWAPSSEACTQPRDGAGDPTVEPGDPNGIPPDEDTPGDSDPGNEGEGGDDPGASSGDPDGDGEGSEGGGDPDPSSGEPDPGSEGSTPEFTPDPSSESDGSSEPVPPTAFLVIGWEPGYDVDSDPAAGYFRHDGHAIETRVLITDRETGVVVLDERIPQYDYENATRRDPGPTVNRFATRLPAGRYEAKVQSVFYRHDEIRFGMDGRWRSLEGADLAPPIDDAVEGVSFNVRELEASSSGSTTGMSGGCQATGSGGFAPSMLLLALLSLGFLRRRSRA